MTLCCFGTCKEIYRDDIYSFFYFSYMRQEGFALHIVCYLWFPNGNIASIYIWKLTAGGLEWSLNPWW